MHLITKHTSQDCIQHNAGVVYLDGYPTNATWKKVSMGEIVIRFVDFDVASFIDTDCYDGIRDVFCDSDFINNRFYWHEDRIASGKDVMYGLCTCSAE